MRVRINTLLPDNLNCIINIDNELVVYERIPRFHIVFKSTNLNDIETYLREKLNHKT